MDSQKPHQYRLPHPTLPGPPSRNSRSQDIRLPVKFEMPGTGAVIGRDNDRLIQPVHQSTLLDLLGGWEPLDEKVPDIDAGLLPLRDITL